MKRILLVAALLWWSAAAAQTPANESDSTEVSASRTEQPAYAYCEIIGSHLPSLSREVIFDFGQESPSLRYNKLQNEQGRKYTFSSMVEALNFMVRQGWEFMQAYSTGEDSFYTHYLLRKPVSQLTDEQCQIWEAEPRTR